MNALKNFIFSLIVLVFFLAILEGTSRIYAYFRPQLDEYAGQIESQGVTPTNKAPNEKRIMIIGESAAKGVPYSFETSMGGYLQSLLNKSGNEHVKIINTAIPGRHSFYQRQQKKSLIRYKADAVIFYAGNNDTRDFSNVIRDVPFADIDFWLTWNSNFYAGFKRKLLKLKKSINKRSGSQVFQINYNQDDVWHWTDTYLKKKLSYLEDPSLGIQRKLTAIQDYQVNLSDLTRFLTKRNIEVFVANLPTVHEATPSIQDWSRKGYEFEQKIIFNNSSDEALWKTFYQQGQEALKNKDFAKALDFFIKAEAINASYPMLHHLKGEALKGLKRFDEARNAFVQSKDLQIQSLGGDSLKTAALKLIAHNHNAFFIDTQQDLEAVAPDGILGDNLFLDHCHPNTLGHKVIAASLMAGLCRSGYISCPNPEGGKYAYWLEKLEGGIIDAKTLAQEYLLTGFYDFNGTAWDPQPHYDRAVIYLEKAKQILPDNKNIYPLLAVSYYHLGEMDQARDSLDALATIDKQEWQKTINEFPFLKEIIRN